MSGDNPFICNDGGFPIQSTVSQVERSLSILEGALVPEPEGTQEISFGYDECWAFQAVIQALRGALQHVVDELDGCTKKEEVPTD